jgi:uncharacterized membrane protein
MSEPLGELDEALWGGSTVPVGTKVYRVGTRLDPVAVLLVGVPAAFYTWVNIYRLDHAYPLEWDLSIFAQGLWLLAHGETPHVSIRGMHLFGEHATYIHLLIAPVYEILEPAAAVRLLVFIQSGALALGAVLLYGIGRRLLGRSSALFVLGAYMLYPPLQFTWLEYYEPVNLAVPCLIGATDAVWRKRTRAALVWSGLSLICMENVAVTVAALGIYAAITGQRRLGIGLAATATVYVWALMTLVFPSLAPSGYVYGHRLYGDFANSLPEAVAYLLRPDHFLQRLWTEANGRFLAGLFLPVACLPLAAPTTLLLAAQLPMNMISSWTYAHEIRYHYVAPIIPFVFLALARALARTAASSAARRRLTFALAAGVALGQACFAPDWIWPLGRSPWHTPAGETSKRRELDALVERIPDEAAVSAHYRFLPHLAHRHRLYMFPDIGPSGTWPDILLVDLGSARGDPRQQELLDRCLARGFREALRTPSGTALFLRPGLRWRPAPLDLEALDFGEEPVRRSPPTGLVPGPPPDPERER